MITLLCFFVVSAVILVSVLNRKIIKFKRTIFITDAIGLGLFTTAGIEVSLLHDLNSTYSIVMGMLTGTSGGLVANVLSNTIQDLLKRRELYATARLIG